MRPDRRPHRGILALAFGLALAAVCVLPAAALGADLAPHVAESQDSDVCAMCHRAHTAAGSTQWSPFGRPDETHSALIAQPTTSTGDVDFCYTCHGVDAIGANSDVQSTFLQPSIHSLDPSTSPYGPSPKQCSDCHDSHGSAKTTAGTPYPALLRSYSPTTGVSYTGEAYCASCHSEKRGIWDGLSVYQQTRHYSEMTTPASGPAIRCLTCHEGHGSSVAPLLRTVLTSPAVDATVQVTANDRTLCFDCHPGPDATYPGGAVYQTSAHALSSKIVSAGGEYASAEATRSVGDCQVCHAAMGAADSAGNAIPKLAVAEGPALCLTCHTVGGIASTDIAGLSYPATAAAGAELVASWAPPTSTAEFSRLAVYTQDATGTAPFRLIGPREYHVPSGTPDRIASGDIDGDTRGELVVAEPGAAQLDIFRSDPLRGLVTTWQPAIAAPGGPRRDRRHHPGRGQPARDRGREQGEREPVGVPGRGRGAHPPHRPGRRRCGPERHGARRRRRFDEPRHRRERQGR
jgi:predicted CXXCH cytochrome family protein